MRDLQFAIDINAPIAHVWATTLDIERWPEWTSTVTRAKLHGSGVLALGTRVTIFQPKLLPAMWKVIAFEPERMVTLRTGFPGLRVIAHHQLAPRGVGCTLTLSLRFEGWLGKWLGTRTREMNLRYLQIEADGIKRRCETSTSSVVN
jgi:hypothetical protein